MTRSQLPYTWPPLLLKATGDVYSYIIYLRSGEKMSFQSAKMLSEEWIELVTDDAAFRSYQIRVSDISVIAEAQR